MSDSRDEDVLENKSSSGPAEMSHLKGLFRPPLLNGFYSTVKNADKDEGNNTQLAASYSNGKENGLSSMQGKGLEKPKPPFSRDGFEIKVENLNIQLEDTKFMTLAEFPVIEEINWIRCDDKASLDFDTLLSGRTVGERITEVEIDRKDPFIDPNVYAELIGCKKLYEDVPTSKYQVIRAKANLYEKVKKGSFMCRAAMKMANLDAILNFELTQPKGRETNVSALGFNELFYFADVCAGPGGFTEYVLWKKKWEAKGFGLTLKGDLDFDIKNFGTAEPETFETIYGPANDGNIYNPENVSAYVQHVLSKTDNKGVHLMMADGGFTVEGQKHLQEVLSHQIILSQVFVALAVVRVGGHFVCKLFDTFTPFTVALIYFMYRSFDIVALHKPRTSRPANSERYLICKWKKAKEVIFPIMNYLADCHTQMWKYQNEEGGSKTITELFPISPLDPFYTYVRQMNNRIASSQIDVLKRMVSITRDMTLENNILQERARIKAMDHWKIPTKQIPMPAMFRIPENACQDLLQELSLTLLSHLEKDLGPGNIQLVFKSAYDWRFVPVSGLKDSINRGIYMSLGKNLVYRYQNLQWVMVSQDLPKLELPSKTLLYGEFVKEIFGTSVSKQVIVETFHIIDAFCLGGIDVRNMHYTQRQEICSKFAKAVTKLGTLPVRAKAPVRMENLTLFISKLKNRVVKGAGDDVVLTCPLDLNDPSSPYVIPEGLVFIKITRDPWQMALNGQTRMKYFFNTKTGASTNNIPENAISGFFNSMENRVIWSWDEETNVTLTNVDKNDPRVAQLSRNRIHSWHLVGYINYTFHQKPTISSSTIDVSKSLDSET